MTKRYAEMGVRELWRLHGPRKSWEFRAEFLALRPGSAPRRLDASEVLEGLTPDDVRDAVDGVRDKDLRSAGAVACRQKGQRIPAVRRAPTSGPSPAASPCARHRRRSPSRAGPRRA